MSLFMNNRLIVSKQYQKAFRLSKYCVSSILFGVYRLLELAPVSHILNGFAYGI